jgi:hypothetical protein
MFRARLLVGGDAYIQRGRFYAATPWQGVQATPSMFRARLLGEAMAKKEIPAAMTYKLAPVSASPLTHSATGRGLDRPRSSKSHDARA